MSFISLAVGFATGVAFMVLVCCAREQIYREQKRTLEEWKNQERNEDGGLY